MKKGTVAIFILWFIIGTAGCTAIPKYRELDELPSDCRQVMALDLDGRSGSYTLGRIEASGRGYMVFDVDLNSGTISAIAVRDVASGEDTCIVRRVADGIYACESYDYQVGSDYTFSLGNAKNVTGSITVYFVSEESLNE